MGISTFPTATARRVHKSPPRRADQGRGANPAPAPASLTFRTASARIGRADVRRRPREQPPPNVLAARRVSRAVDRRPCGPDVRGFSIRRDDNVFVAERSWLGGRCRGFSPGRSATQLVKSGGRVSVFDKDGRVIARWGSAGRLRRRQLRRAAQHRRRLARRHLRGGGDVDLRGQPRPRPRELPHVPEIQARVLTRAAVTDSASATRSPTTSSCCCSSVLGERRRQARPVRRGPHTRSRIVSPRPRSIT